MAYKAAYGFWYKVDKDGRYHQDAKQKWFAKGDDLPEAIAFRLIQGNPEAVEVG